MNIKGAITYCDRCGFKIFRKNNKCYTSLLSSYYTEDLEQLPDGWREFGNEHLCPNCAKAWESAIKPIKLEEK